MNRYTPHNILVTGGAGFIGSNFIRHLQTIHPTTTIINLDALTYAGSLDNLVQLPYPHQHIFQRGDICDKLLVLELLNQYNIDTIVHFAAESHVDRSLAGPGAFITTNLVGTFTLLEAAREYWLEQQHFSETQCRFHHISTDEVYGSLSKNELAFTEKTAFAPNSPYSASKAGSDHLVRAYHHSYGVPVTISNCSNNYGPYQHDEKLIPTIIRQCLQQKPIPLYGDGSNIRDWLYVEDHCDAILTIITEGKNGETYNVGGCNEWSNLSIAQYICHQMDKLLPQPQTYETLIHFVTDRPGHDWRYAIDNSKIKNELDWSPNESFESGIKKTIQFYLQRST
jgi:dTDP-glucose 4,6-dehydratase